MRKWLLFPVWASVGLLVYACDDDSPAASQDGGTDAPVTKPTPDAGFTDQSSPPVLDATVTDTTPLTAPTDVQVLDGNGAGVPAIDVYFNEPNGNVIRVTTDANGHATHIMLGGGSITALRIDGTTQSPSYDVATVLDVQPGDAIRLIPQPGPAAINVATVSGNFVGAPPLQDAAALTYDLDFGGCNAGPVVNGTTSYTANLGADCIVPTKGVSFLARAKDGSGAVVAYAPKTVLIPDGGTFNVDIATADWVAAQAKQATFTGTFSSPFNFIQSDIGAPRNGFEYGVSSTSNSVVPPTLTYYPAPAAFAPNVQAITQVSGYFMGNDYVVVAHGVRGPSATTAIAEDLTQNLARISGVTTGGTNSAPSVQWASPIGVAAVGSAALASYHTPDGGPGYQVTWQIVFPAATTTAAVQFPALPPAVSALVSPDFPWSVNDITLLVSTQLPYAIGHLVPTALGAGVNGMTQIANQIPGLTVFDARLTEIKPNSG